MKKKENEKKIEELSNWEWTTLVAAWRYYESRSTIASAMFPEDIVSRFWGSGKYSDAALHKIANQFANIDHRLDGESFWADDKTLRECDRRPWCTFYAFCKHWADGFPLVVLDGVNGDGKHVHDEIRCFHCDMTGKWHPVDKYIEAPFYNQYCADEFIVEVRK